MAEDMKSLGDLETVSTSSEATVETTIVREPKRDDFGRSYACLLYTSPSPRDRG